MIDAKLKNLEDVEFQGFLWKGNDLNLNIRSNDYTSLTCAWAYDLVLNLTWESSSVKKSGVLLSVGGAVEQLTDEILQMNIDFGSSGSLSVKCEQIVLKKSRQDYE